MASSTLVVKGNSLADVDPSGGTTLSLVGVTANGALYRDAAQELTLPFTLEFINKVGAPGSLGNDQLSLVFTQAKRNTTTQKVVVLRGRLDISVPRDEVTIGAAEVKNLLGFITSIIGKAAHRDAISDAIVP